MEAEVTDDEEEEEDEEGYGKGAHYPLSTHIKSPTPSVQMTFLQVLRAKKTMT